MLLLVVGSLVGFLFGLRMVWAYRDAGRWGRRFVLLCAVLGPTMVLGIVVRHTTGWW